MRAVTSGIMAEIDRRAREEYGISSSVLMENAGRSIAEDVIADGKNSLDAGISVLCGKGNNGGDGFVAARYLKNSGFENVEIFVPDDLKIKQGATEENFRIVNKMGIKVSAFKAYLRKHEKNSFVVIDALFGIGFAGGLSGEYISVVQKVNGSGVLVYSADVPSGLDATTGQAPGGCVRAYKTITFGLPKCGFYMADGPAVCGEIIVKDIGFPKRLLEEYM